MTQELVAKIGGLGYSKMGDGRVAIHAPTVYTVCSTTLACNLSKFLST